MNVRMAGGEPVKRRSGFFPRIVHCSKSRGLGTHEAPRRKMLLFFSLVLCLQLFVSACGSLKPPTFPEVIAAFSGGTPPSSPTSTSRPTEVAAVRFFVDCSSGMKGFVFPSPSGLASNYTRVLETMNNVTSGYERSWRCADVQSLTRGMAERALFEPTVYQTSSHSFGSLLATLNLPVMQPDKPSIDVVISDFAGAEGGDTIGNLAAELRKQSEQKRHLLLWAFRSSYFGEYAPASRECGGRKFPLRQGQTLPGLGRPFYVLISAPDGESLKRLTKNLSDQLLPSQEFAPARPPVELSKLDSSGASNPKAQNTKEILPSVIRRGAHKVRELQIDKSSSFPVRAYSIFTVDDSRNFTVSFRWIAQLNIPLDPAKINAVATQIKAWPAKESTEGMQAKEGVEVAPAGDLTIKLDAAPDDRGHVTYAVTFPPQASQWRVYRITLNAGDGNSPVPKWISDWSVAADCDSASGNRTVSLRELGQVFSMELLRDRPFLEHYIAVRRK